MTNEEWQAKLEELRASLSSPKTVLVVERELYQQGHDGCFSSSYLVPSEKLTLLRGTTMSGHNLLFEKIVGHDAQGLTLVSHHDIFVSKQNSIMIDTSALAKALSSDAVDMFLDPRCRPMWFTPDGRFPYDDPDFMEIVQAFEKAKFPMLEIIVGEEAIADWLSGVQDERLVGVMEMFRRLSLLAPRSEKLDRRLPFVLARLDRMKKAEAERVTEARLALDKATKHLAEKKKLDEEEARLKRTAERIGLLSGLEA